MNSSSVSNTSVKGTVPRTCSTCFYGAMKDSHISPCKRCDNYSEYITDSVFFWGEETVKSIAPKEDKVNKPKHYMLFPEYNLEVRQVIQRLMDKMDKSDIEFSPIDYADYFQAMAYFMRFMEKNGKEDLQKGVWYMNKILEAWEEDEE